jgi:cell division protein FtsQ
MRAMSWLGIGDKPRRGRTPPAWRRLALRWGPVALAGLLLFGGIAWLWRSGVVAAAAERSAAVAWAGVDAASTALGLVVEEVWITGRAEADRRELLAALGVSRGSPILRFDPAAARERMEALGWVREATVRRSLPNEIHVEIVERKPMALWQSQGRMVLIGQDAVPITSRNLGRFSNLPLLVGEDAPRHATGLFDVLAAEPGLEKRVVSAVRVGGRRWNLKLDNEVEVRLPEQDALAAWMRLGRLDREQGVLSRDVAVLDLRLPDRVVLKLGRDAQREVLPSKDKDGRGLRKKPAPGQNT